MKIKCIKHISDSYPKKLHDISTKPKQLYYLGVLPDEKSYKIAVVGSRKVTKYGRYATQTIVSELARLGVVIISGLALGVDGLAHRAALDSDGLTAAVMPCGLDQIYPATHRALAKDILKSKGALISEYDEGTPPLIQHFPARNRIVSGIADAILITEAAKKSGSLITANFALEQGKTVMAVPGNINSPMSAGTNNLIKTGAFPVTSAQDVLDACGIVDLLAPSKKNRGDNKDEQTILDILGEGPLDGDSILMKTKMSPSQLSKSLTMLELKGIIRNQGSNIWTL